MGGALKWKMTVVGGSDNGRDYEFPADQAVSVGRSRDTQLRISKRDVDVSGHHVEFSVENGTPMVRNISTNPLTKVNGVPLPSNEQTAVACGFEVALGEMVRIRLDEVPGPDLEAQTGTDPGELTEATNASLTAPTHWQGQGTPADEPTAVMEETGITSATAFDDSRPTNDETKDSAATSDQSTMAAESYPEDDETEASRDSETMPPDSDSETPVIDQKQIDEARKKLIWRERMRRLLAVGALGVAALGLAGLWYVTRNTDEVQKTTIVDKAEKFAIRNAAGQKMLEVDYPAAPKRSVTPAPDNSGVTVVSYQGRDRDVPFFLQLETLSHPDELKLDLIASVRRWLGHAATSGEGFIFDDHLADSLKVQFMEDVYPESCEKPSLYGVRFIEFEYERTWSDSRVWHGIAIYLRRGDSVYLLRREIPQSMWDRGGYRLHADPNLAVYATFPADYWESPGEQRMPVERKTAELMENVRQALGKEMAADWRFVKRDIDALLARSWRTDSKTHALAMSFLRQFRERLEHFYWEKYNAVQAVKGLAERDPRTMRKLVRHRQDAQVVFDDPGERYYYLTRDGGVW